MLEYLVGKHRGMRERHGAVVTTAARNNAEILRSRHNHDDYVGVGILPTFP